MHLQNILYKNLKKQYLAKPITPPTQQQSTPSGTPACELPKVNPIPCQQRSAPATSTAETPSQLDSNLDSTLLQRHHPNLSFEVISQHLRSTPLSAASFFFAATHWLRKLGDAMHMSNEDPARSIESGQQWCPKGRQELILVLTTSPAW